MATDELSRSAWSGIDPAQSIAVHVHLAGTGDSGGGSEVKPQWTASSSSAVPLCAGDLRDPRFLRKEGCMSSQFDLLKACRFAPFFATRAFFERKTA
jgi:hypothetical protein